MRSLINDFVKFHDIWMPEIGKSINLSVDCHLCFFILEVLLIIRLDGYQVFGLFVLGSSDNSKGSCTDLQVYLEVFKV